MTQSKQILKSSKSNFAIAFFGLPPEQRKALEAVYAYCRIVDDIADESATVAEAQTGLDAWRQALQNPQAMTSYIPSLVARDLQWAVETYPMLTSDLVWILDGVEKDLTHHRYTTLDELFEYCDAVASAVGFCCMTIFGVDRDQASRYVYATGRALQLTNILRDIASDAKRDRIYIPKTYLVEAGLKDEDILNSRYDEGFVNMTQAFSNTIQSLYVASDEESKNLMLRKIWPAEIMKNTYRSIFKKIQKKQYDVFSEAIKIGSVQKLWIALSQPRA